MLIKPNYAIHVKIQKLRFFPVIKSIKDVKWNFPAIKFNGNYIPVRNSI